MNHTAPIVAGKTPPERFLITFEAGADILSRPAEIRLRSLLKIAKRGLALKCITAQREDGSAVVE